MTMAASLSLSALESILSKWDGVHPADVTLIDVADDLTTIANAAPVLIAVVKAALAYTRPVETEQDARDKETARRALHSALKAVRP